MSLTKVLNLTKFRDSVSQTQGKTCETNYSKTRDRWSSHSLLCLRFWDQDLWPWARVLGLDVDA